VMKDVVMAILLVLEAALVEPRSCHEGSRPARSVHVCAHGCPKLFTELMDIGIRNARFTSVP